MIPKIKIYQSKYSNPKFSYVSIVVLIGSIYEKKNQEGISHFIEHLIFKGSKYNENIKNLNNKLNSMGMVVNAYTSQFLTKYYIHTPTIYIKEAIEALVQIVFNPLFRNTDIDDERQVVINELLQKYSSPDNLASMKAQKIMYSKENPLHKPVIGNIETLKKITKDDILNYYLSYYQPKNMIFNTSTKKNKNSIKKIWENAFENFGKNKFEYKNVPSTLSIFQKIKPKLSLIGKPNLYNLSNYFPNNKTNYVLISFVLQNLTKKERFVLDIFTSYLAGSLSSKLFIELREKRKLIYSISSYTDTNVDLTIMYIEFECEKDDKILYDCIKTIDKVLRYFYKNGMPKKEFEKFKNKNLINYEKIESSGPFKINKYLSKYYYGVSEYGYKNILKKITNNYLNKHVEKIIKNKKEFVFIT